MSTVLNKSDVRGVDSMGASFLSSPFGSGKEINKIPVRVEGSAGALLTVPKAVPFEADGALGYRSAVPIGP
jgi:hypothetical protein